MRPPRSAGYSVLISTSQTSASSWIFMDAFSWTLWVALVLTAAGVGVVLWLLEPWTTPRRRPCAADYKADALQAAVWNSISRPMQAGGGFRFFCWRLACHCGRLGPNCCQPASQPGALELHAPRLRMCRLEAGCSQGAAPRSCVAAPAWLPTTAAPPRLQTQDMVGRSLATNLVITIYAFMVGAGGRGRGRGRHTQPAAPPPVQQRRPAWPDHQAQRLMPEGCRVSNPPPLPHHPLRHTRRC